MTKHSDMVSRCVFCILGIVVCITCLLLFGVPEYHGLLRKPAEPTEQIAPVTAQTPEAVPEHAAETPEPAAETPEPAYIHPLAEALFDLTNQERIDAGLNALAYAYELQEAADARAYESSVQFSHTRPNGKSCHSVVDQYDYYVTGENLLKADAPLAVPEVMMSKWMLSDGHRENILLPDFTRLAIGIYEKKGVVYAAQIFLG